MGLLKASSAPAAKAVAFSMTDVEAHAQTLLSRARTQAEKLISEALLEGNRIRAERYDEGYAEGRKAGYAEGIEDGTRAGHDAALAATSKKIEGLVAALADAAVHLEASRRKLETETVYDVIRLSVAIARRVTKSAAFSDPEVVRGNVLEALRMVVNASSVKVALNPVQLSVLETELPAIRAMFPKLASVELVPDPSLEPGGCRLLTGSGIVDADLDTQLDRIVADLLPAGTEAPR